MKNGNIKCPQYQINLASPFRFDTEGAECISKKKKDLKLSSAKVFLSARKYKFEIHFCEKWVVRQNWGKFI